jgi:hypothetical protein
MAQKTIRVSDLSGTQIPDAQQSGARLIVEHPDYTEPIGLDVLADEVAPYLTEENSRFVVLSLSDPDNPNQNRYVISVEEFDRLFQSGDSTSVLQEAFETQQQEQEAAISSRGRGKRGAASGSTSTRERIDYASPEHAGMPHRGTISEAEKEQVRNNLDEVNRRRREQGHDEIDPTDPRMATRYGFEPPVNGSATTERTETRDR